MGAGEPIQRVVTLGHENGLHLTPIQLLVRKSTDFESDISIKFDGKVASAKSALELMVLGPTKGALLDVEAKGVDAEEAIQVVSSILEGREG